MPSMPSHLHLGSCNGWPGRGAERLREMAEKIGSGHRMQSYTRDNPLRPDALTRWRDNGSVQ